MLSDLPAAKSKRKQSHWRTIVGGTVGVYSLGRALRSLQ